jgi:hypothetical protein
MRTFSRLVAVAIVLCFLGACSYVTTVNPVGVSRGVQQDARLAGAWKLVEINGKPAPPSARGKAYVIFTPETAGEYSAVISSWESGKPNTDTFILDLVIGRVADQTLLSAKLLGELSKPGKLDAADRDSIKGYWPVLYRIDGDGRLRFYKMSDKDFDKVRQAIESSQLEGTIQKTILANSKNGRSGRDVQVNVTAAPKALDSYFEKEIPSIFSEPLYTFQKID